jgi:hypothetical protein
MTVGTTRLTCGDAALRRSSLVAILIEVDDAGDPRLDDYRDLTTADRRPGSPGGRGLVIAEGVVVVAPIDRLTVPRPVASRGDLDGLRTGRPTRRPRRAYASTDADTMAAVVGFHLNRGVLAVADRADRPIARPSPPVRTAAGRRGGRQRPREPRQPVPQRRRPRRRRRCCSDPRCADPLYRRSVRVSMGHVLRVPFAELPGEWPGSLDAAAGGRAAGGGADAGARRAAAGRGRSDGTRTALLLGAEGPGLTAEALRGRRPAGAHPDGHGVSTLSMSQRLPRWPSTR